MSKRKRPSRRSPYHHGSCSKNRRFLSEPPLTIDPVLWGNSGGEQRPLYTRDDIDAGALDGVAVLNSTIDGIIGNESLFTAIRARDHHFSNHLLIPSQTNEYLLRTYVCNNNRFGDDFCAINTSVAFELPQTASDSQTITGHIFSENTRYHEYWSQAKLIASRPFRLEYIPGSALLENNGVGKNGGCALDDSIAENRPVKIGYTGLNGRLPGGYHAACYISIRIRAVFED